MMNNNCKQGKKELFDMIGAVSFYLDDLRLFLDTHPDNTEALELFTQYQAQRHEMVKNYTLNYGPIDSYYVNTENGWTWNDCPMPWKAEAN